MSFLNQAEVQSKVDGIDLEAFNNSTSVFVYLNDQVPAKKIADNSPELNWIEVCNKLQGIKNQLEERRQKAKKVMNANSM